MSWTRDGTEIRNAEGHKLVSARYGAIKPCSMKVSEQEKTEALRLRVQAPELYAALYACLIRLEHWPGSENPERFPEVREARRLLK